MYTFDRFSDEIYANFYTFVTTPVSFVESYRFPPVPTPTWSARPRAPPLKGPRVSVNDIPYGTVLP